MPTKDEYLDVTAPSGDTASEYTAAMEVYAEAALQTAVALFADLRIKVRRSEKSLQLGQRLQRSRGLLQLQFVGKKFGLDLLKLGNFGFDPNVEDYLPLDAIGNYGPMIEIKDGKLSMGGPRLTAQQIVQSGLGPWLIAYAHHKTRFYRADPTADFRRNWDTFAAEVLSAMDHNPFADGFPTAA